ncbi:hemolysin activation/secretion protein [Azomonas agilis]|uniref:Hemolysin activation/secretion protein n=1 Tax=Azomonas agilis TaxID=116849 RepID=A0A562J094_9GAMM|nr:hemolysin activation/secretion protein [Azomonas agilis]
MRGRPDSAGDGFFIFYWDSRLVSHSSRTFIGNLNYRNLLTLLAIFVGSGLFSGYSLAQSLPNYDSADAIRDSAPPKPPLPKQPPQAPILLQEEPSLVLPEGKTLFVKAFRLENAQFVDEQELLALLVPYQNRALSMGEILEAANQITQHYRKLGYLVAKAYIPKQDASEGVLSIRVIVGEYGRIQLINQSRVSDRFLQQILDQQTKDSSGAVTRDGLERAMLLIYDLPGASMPSVTIAPGAQYGTSDFEVSVEPGDLINGYLMYDNHGSRYTGKNRMSFGLDIASPLGFGDGLSISGMTSERKSQGLESGRIAYSFPLLPNGLRMTLAASRTTYELGEEYSDLDAHGTSEIFEGTLSYPVIRTRQNSLYLSLNLAKKSLRDEIKQLDTSTTRSIKVARFGVQQDHFGDLLGMDLFSSLFAGISFGRLDIRGHEDRAFNRAGADTLGDFSKLNLSWSGNLALTPTLTGLISLSAQKSLSSNLDSSEQMSISGTSGVKSYPEGISEDSGYLFNGELRRSLPSLFGIEHAAGIFFDMGRVYQEDASYTSERNGTKLKDIGLSYNLSTKYLFGRMMFARTLGPQDNLSERHTQSRFLAQLGLKF